MRHAAITLLAAILAYPAAANPDDDARAALALARQAPRPPQFPSRATCPADCPCGCAENEECDCAVKAAKRKKIASRKDGTIRKATDDGADWRWNASRKKWQRPSGQEGSTGRRAGQQAEQVEYTEYRLYGVPGPTYSRPARFFGRFRGNGGCSGGG